MGWVVYATKWVNRVLNHEPQLKTQPHNTQHITHNMSCRRPILQQRWPSLSMVTSAMDPTLGAASPYGPIHSTWCQDCSQCCWFLCFGVTKCSQSKNRKMHHALAFGGCCFIGITNNWLIVAKAWVEAHVWESMRGDTVPLFGATIQTTTK